MAERDPEINGRGNYPAYGADYGAWIAAQSSLLRESRFSELDIVNLIDEVESLGRSDFRVFMSALRVVIVHMLKWDAQEHRRTPSWIDSIDEQRKQVRWELKDSPSYERRADEAIARVYSKARRKAAKETRLPAKHFPETCPFTFDEIMTREHHLRDGPPDDHKPEQYDA